MGNSVWECVLAVRVCVSCVWVCVSAIAVCVAALICRSTRRKKLNKCGICDDFKYLHNVSLLSFAKTMTSLPPNQCHRQPPTPHHTASLCTGNRHTGTHMRILKLDYFVCAQQF